MSTQNFGHSLFSGKTKVCWVALSSSHSLYFLAFLYSVNEAIVVICYWLLKEVVCFTASSSKTWFHETPAKLNSRRCSVHFFLLCHHHHEQIHLALIQLSLPLKWGGNFHTVRMFYCNSTLYVACKFCNILSCSITWNWQIQFIPSIHLQTFSWITIFLWRGTKYKEAWGISCLTVFMTGIKPSKESLL